MSVALPGDPSREPALVTGGTGFLGRRIVERLLGQGRPVWVVARNPAPDLEARGVRFIRADLEDTDAIRASCAGARTVFHVAAKIGVWGPYGDYFRANVLSTPSVVYNGRDISGADESLPLTRACPCPYPPTKAVAEAEVLAANGPGLATVALRPHLIWGPKDPHLVPGILRAARSGRLRIVGGGRNRVSMVHVENAADAHIAAEQALRRPGAAAAGRAYFVTDGEPVVLWEWVNALLAALGEPPITRSIPLGAAHAVGAACEAAWWLLRLRGQPPMTRFVAAELARDHWFDITAARRDLGYAPRVSPKEAMAELVASLRVAARSAA
jgi:nucleoside-diphosphate-sugar epimerase